MKPTLLARYGTLLTCALLLLIALFTWVIKYPDIVSSRARLTGTNAPIPVMAKQSARLQALKVQNGDTVTAGQLIGHIETTADVAQVLQFSGFIDSLCLLIQQNRISSIAQKMEQSFSNLGELQADYQSFVQVYLPYRDLVAGNYAVQKKHLLHNDAALVQQSRQVLNQQQKLNNQDIELNNQTLLQNKKLLDQKLISEQEYRELMSQNLGKHQSEPQLQSGYISNQSQVNGIKKEILELDNQVATQKALFSQAALQLKSRIADWKSKYLLLAAHSGKLAFTSFLQANQIVEAGKPIAYIIPGNSEVYMETMIPQANFGKVNVRQKVLLKFDAYPWQEFGLIEGRIIYINPIPTDSGYYLAKVALPQNLQTNYNKSIPFVEGLVAQSEIVTRDLRLAENLYYDLIKTIRK